MCSIVGVWAIAMGSSIVRAIDKWGSHLWYHKALLWANYILFGQLAHLVWLLPIDCILLHSSLVRAKSVGAGVI